MTSTQCTSCYYKFTYEPNDLIVKRSTYDRIGDEETYDMYYVKCPSCQKESCVRRKLVQYDMDIYFASNRDVNPEGFWLLEKNGEVQCIIYYSNARKGIHVIYGNTPSSAITYNSLESLRNDGFTKIYREQEKIDRLIKQLNTNPNLTKIWVSKSWF